MTSVFRRSSSRVNEAANPSNQLVRIRGAPEAKQLPLVQPAAIESQRDHRPTRAQIQVQELFGGSPKLHIVPFELHIQHDDVHVAKQRTHPCSRAYATIGLGRAWTLHHLESVDLQGLAEPSALGSIRVHEEHALLKSIVHAQTIGATVARGPSHTSHGKRDLRP